MAIESPVNNNVDAFYCKIRHKGKYNESRVCSSTNSVVTCHNCGEKVHLKIIKNPIEMVLMGNCSRHQ